VKRFCPKKIYVFKCEQFYKIGITNSPKKRFDTLAASIPFEMSIVVVYDPKFKEPDEYKKRRRYCRIEKYLHKFFQTKRINGEWFKLNQNDLDMIPELIKKSISGHEIVEQEIEYIPVEVKG
jgi:hypothetical protein